MLTSSGKSMHGQNFNYCKVLHQPESCVVRLQSQTCLSNPKSKEAKQATGTHLWGRISRIWLMSMTLGKGGNPAAHKQEAARKLRETQSAGMHRRDGCRHEERKGADFSRWGPPPAPSPRCRHPQRGERRGGGAAPSPVPVPPRRTRRTRAGAGPGGARRRGRPGAGAPRGRPRRIWARWRPPSARRGRGRHDARGEQRARGEQVEKMAIGTRMAKAEGSDRGFCGGFALGTPFQVVGFGLLPLGFCHFILSLATTHSGSV